MEKQEGEWMTGMKFFFLRHIAWTMFTRRVRSVQRPTSTIDEMPVNSRMSKQTNNHPLPLKKAADKREPAKRPKKLRFLQSISQHKIGYSETTKKLLSFCYLLSYSCGQWYSLAAKYLAHRSPHICTERPTRRMKENQIE